MKKSLAVCLVASTLFAGCSSYDLGDVPRVYCASTSPEFRAKIKVVMQKKGGTVGPDYCAISGLVDALIVPSFKE